FLGEQKPVLIFEALKPARRYVVLDWRRGLVRLWFSRKPFSHLVVLPEQIQSVHRCHSLHSNHMLNRGYAYTTIVSSKHHGRTLLSHLASLYPHSTPQAWQQNLNNGELTVNGVTATGS